MAKRKSTSTKPLVLTRATLAAAVAELCAMETRFAPVVAAQGLPSLRKMPGGLEGLLRIVTDQFLSLQAAAAIWARLCKRLSPLTPETVLATPQADLVTLGLSRAKAKSFHGIALAMASGNFDPSKLASMPDEMVQAELVKLPGIGPWSAEIYLLASLQRADIWPAGDLALQHAAQNLFQLEARPQGKAMVELGQRFSPHRAVAARLLWSHYRSLKGLKQA
jgi:DNA-3-methyladenine glycosylase II